MSTESVDKFEKNDLIPAEHKAYYRELAEKEMSGLVYFEKTSGELLSDRVENLHLSQCYHCAKIAVWVRQKLLFPSHKNGTQPNPDLPDDIIRDFEEARSIVDASPRGAAALLRLCVQKLCSHLGENGKNIDDDIASLVGKGLSPLIANSLDAVRVIGNESVHPGKIDLRDDRVTALQLFDLVNTIADKLITHPKQVDQIYKKIPPAKREAIEKRNAKAKGESQ